MNNQENYDIILIHMLPRLHSYYLNIIKALSKECTIGVYYMPCNELTHRRNQLNNEETDRLIFDLYVEFGAEILDNSKNFDCNLLLLPQYSFDKNRIKTINYNSIIMLGAFAYGGYLLKEFREIGGSKFWTYEEKIFKDVVKVNKQKEIAQLFEIREFGLPHKKYPAFDFSNLEIDYLIAYPTRVFLREKYKENDLNKSIIDLMKNIPREKNIYFKEHNVNDPSGKKYVVKGDEIITISESSHFGEQPVFKKAVSRIGKVLIIPLSFFKVLLRLIIRKDYQTKSNNSRVIGYVSKSLIKRRTISLSDVTPHHYLNIYHFLPFVRNGVITGISTCQWNALYERIPVYNCDNQEFSNTFPNYNVVNNYYVPPCNGKLIFDENNYKKVKPPEDKEDMIEIIKNEIQ